MTALFTKESLITRLREIRQQGWIENTRNSKNSGSVGNILEDLLGITENNLPLPNAAEWELKCHRLGTNSLTTLLHIEPSPRALKFVSNVLLPKYGWPHQEAGKRYSEQEKSFRQTICNTRYSDRGFKVVVDRNLQKILISFCSKSVSERHSDWLGKIAIAAGLDDLDPQPYWGFQDIYHKAGGKLLNCFFIGATTKKEQGKEFFKYESIYQLSDFSLERFITAIEKDDILIDFDARTGHNHGTKFRFRNGSLPELYENVKEI